MRDLPRATDLHGRARGTSVRDAAAPQSFGSFMGRTDPVYAQRSATKMYRTTPLRALWQRALYFHDGSAPSLAAVVGAL